MRVRGQRATTRPIKPQELPGVDVPADVMVREVNGKNGHVAELRPETNGTNGSNGVHAAPAHAINLKEKEIDLDTSASAEVEDEVPVAPSVADKQEPIFLRRRWLAKDSNA